MLYLAYYIIMPAEISANLARFDGISYVKNSKCRRITGSNLKRYLF